MAVRRQQPRLIRLNLDNMVSSIGGFTESSEAEYTAAELGERDLSANRTNLATGQTSSTVNRFTERVKVCG